MREKMKGTFYVIVAMIAGLAGILFGYDTGVMSGAILFIGKEFTLSPLVNGIVVAAVLLGAFLGAILSGVLTDRYGRRKVLIAVSLVFIVGTALSASVFTISLLIFARFIVGIAIGIASYAAPLYISEISPPRYRGALVSLNQLTISVGILLSYIVDYLFSASENWRGMLAIGVLPALFLLAGMYFLPSSPRWLVGEGRKTDALDVLATLRGSMPLAVKELDDIVETTKQEKGSFAELFSKKVRPVLWIGALLAIIQQVTGINTILYYAPTIFEMAGFHSSTASILATMGVGVIFVLFTVIALPLIDSWGRRPLLLLGLSGMFVSLSALSMSFFILRSSGIGKGLALASMLVYIASFAISLGPIMWLMIAEIYPLRVRGMGASFATCINWASNWLVTVTFLTLVSSIGTTGTFLLYACFCIASLLFVVFFVPETKGVTLEKIERNLFAGKPWRKLGV